VKICLSRAMGGTSDAFGVVEHRVANVLGKLMARGLIERTEAHIIRRGESNVSVFAIWVFVYVQPFYRAAPRFPCLYFLFKGTFADDSVCPASR
jgi:hypothetical protein